MSAAPARLAAVPTPAKPRAPAGDIPTLDWQGQPVDCAACPHMALQTAGGCEPGHSCMQDAYARRIDRFFHQHPALAQQHLDHPYFEVRAIAVRHVDLFHLNALRSDPDETVRLQVVLRLPQRQLALMCDDPHREVRIRVAQRLDDTQLGRLLHDPDDEVRHTVALRLPQALLPTLAQDRDARVRHTVAQRLAMPALWRLADDAAPEVRRVVAQRAPVALLTSLLHDADWSVRWEVAHRADPLRQRALLLTLAADPDVEVSAQARERLGGLVSVTSTPEAEVHPHG
ncbi:MAG: hypothetical protein RJA98_2154 [Pseudomonadota bacterium]